MPTLCDILNPRIGFTQPSELNISDESCDETWCWHHNDDGCQPNKSTFVSPIGTFKVLE